MDSTASGWDELLGIRGLATSDSLLVLLLVAVDILT